MDRPGPKEPGLSVLPDSCLKCELTRLSRGGYACETEDNCDLSEQIPYYYDHFRKGKIPRIARVRQGRNRLLSVESSPPDPLHYDRHPLAAGEWDASAQRAVSPEPGRVPVWQCRIACDVDLLRRIIRDLDREGRPYTVDDVADRFGALPRGVGVTAFMREQIAQLTADNRLGTAATTRARSTVFWAFSAAASCLSPRSPSGWSRSTTLTCCAAGSSGTPCRSTCASCARFTTRRSAGGWAEPASPFGGVYTGVDRTRKRAIDERLIARLKNLDLPVSGPLPLARDLFVFSYCARGMAFVDMAFLRKKT